MILYIYKYSYIRKFNQNKKNLGRIDKLITNLAVSNLSIKIYSVFVVVKMNKLRWAKRHPQVTLQCLEMLWNDKSFHLVALFLYVFLISRKTTSNKPSTKVNFQPEQ